MSEEIKLTIEVLTFLGGLIGLYFKMKYDVAKNADDITKNADKIDELQEQLDKHEELTPSCIKRFEALTLDIQSLQTQEKMKDKYQQEIVEKILQPILKDIVDSMKNYTDSKMQILTNELKVYQTDNQIFKEEIKSYLKELKDENKANIKQLIAALKKSK